MLSACNPINQFTFQDVSLYIQKECEQRSYPDCLEICRDQGMRMFYCMEKIYLMNETHYIIEIYPGSYEIRLK